ncbi:MAG: DUF1659 domain-containing protein [Clostridium sp.]|uniref:DUF1659 domain-containing protein n=1 Tax=Clostridium sp. TaxID=1506 RepID=UPI0025BA59FB|nr:DUF1659 domain-containing protein [Clostridium sp.]MCH3965989.1 DUF1659 domain-containing protein [Clostridium sp.]MCI1715923.1 DUF1659 domain-containing protein [Clostridium sp.]MCI1800405.1 DUF1659 domain-containing protein [Clostridium sp.]MCI1814100.1 DUF1659 domain-containing protein [Clostridium sp.]MCI1870998.1 DUF1659 domain-containing protein [Clostridium sp.]
MAAQSTKLQTSLVIKYQDGVDEDGKDVVKSQKFSKVKVMATDDEIYNTSMEIGKLIGKTLDEIIKIDQNNITG